VNDISRKLRTDKLSGIIRDLQEGAVVLDIGVWCSMPEPHPAENWVEKSGLGHGKLIAVGLEDMKAFKKKYPNIWCVQANGCALPFKNGAVDIAFANAVLEHVPTSCQKDFVSEIARVARTYAMLAVPDYLCPIEVHSRIPFLHWFPGWRRLFQLVGEKYWASPSNLASIFTKQSLEDLIKLASGSSNWIVKRQTFLGIPVSLIAFCWKQRSISRRS